MELILECNDKVEEDLDDTLWMRTVHPLYVECKMVGGRNYGW